MSGLEEKPGDTTHETTKKINVINIIINIMLNKRSDKPVAGIGNGKIRSRLILKSKKYFF